MWVCAWLAQGKAAVPCACLADARLEGSLAAANVRENEGGKVRARGRGKEKVRTGRVW